MTNKLDYAGETYVMEFDAQSRNRRKSIEYYAAANRLSDGAEVTIIWQIIDGFDPSDDDNADNACDWNAFEVE